MNSSYWLIKMIIFKKFKEIQKFVSPKRFVHYSKYISKNLINQKNALFATITLCTAGLIFKKQEENKKYPESNVEKVEALFKERKIYLDPKNQIKNTEIEDLMKNVVDLAKRKNSIYLIYGESGIGKSIAMKKTLLRNPNLDFLYIENGIDELVKKLVPDYNSNTSHFTLEKVIDNALKDYGDYRKQMKQKQPENFQENAIIVIDNTNEIEDEKLLQKFKDIIKITLIDNYRPIVFIFLSNKGKGPSVLMRNMSRMTVFHAKEPSKQFALDYFESHGIPKEYYSELEKITGSNLKYLIELNWIDKNLSKEEYLKSAKRLVHAKISPEIEKWLIEEDYPEIIQICQLILQNGSVSKNEYSRISRTEENLKIKREMGWQQQVLKENLFQVDEDGLQFQNRATKQYVKEYLKK
jgi:hypothetical protein